MVDIMRVLVFVLVVILVSLTKGHALRATKTVKPRLRLKQTRRNENIRTRPGISFHRNSTTLYNGRNKRSLHRGHGNLPRNHSNTVTGKQSRSWRSHVNNTTSSTKRQNVVAFTGDTSQNRLFHVDETGTLHRHEVGPEEFSTPEGKTETFSNDKGITEGMSNFRPTLGKPTEPLTREFSRPSDLYDESATPSQWPSYPTYTRGPDMGFTYQPPTFTAPSGPYEHPHHYESHPLMEPNSKPIEVTLPSIPHESHVIPFPTPHHMPYMIPVTKVHHVPYPIMVPVRQPPILKPVPVPVAVPYPVVSPPRVRNVPYPVPVPVHSPPEVHVQRVPVPVPLPQMPHVHVWRPMFPRPIIRMPVGLSECSTNPCRNGGRCYLVEDTYKCRCITGFKGRHCEETSKCHPNPCENFGECTVLQDGYECSCRKGFRGSRCEVRDQCHPSPCKNGGSCTSVGDEYACSCVYGFIGRNCEVESKCFPLNPCKHGGTCYEEDMEYKCTCMPGWAGVSCEIPDPCSRNPCDHEGVCSALGTAYSCSCKTGYLGKTCEIESQCHSSRPCQNGGTCREHGLEGYRCHCNNKWGGDNCEIPYSSQYAYEKK